MRSLLKIQKSVSNIYWWHSWVLEDLSVIGAIGLRDTDVVKTYTLQYSGSIPVGWYIFLKFLSLLRCCHFQLCFCTGYLPPILNWAIELMPLTFFVKENCFVFLSRYWVSPPADLILMLFTYGYLVRERNKRTWRPKDVIGDRDTNKNLRTYLHFFQIKAICGWSSMTNWRRKVKFEIYLSCIYIFYSLQRNKKWCLRCFGNNSYFNLACRKRRTFLFHIWDVARSVIFIYQ